MIGFNQADYTAWQYRWLCLDALGSDLQHEYDFTDCIMENNAKNYQLWNHRRKCALRMGVSAAEVEMNFAADALLEDEKNYHAWAHRQAIVQAFGLWSSEVEFVNGMIDKDVRNNSAWNQRAFLLKVTLSAWLHLNGQQQQQQQGQQQQQTGETPSHGSLPPPALIGIPSESLAAAAAAALTAWDQQPDGEGPPPENSPAVIEGEGLQAEVAAILNRELVYAATQVQRAPRNESAWNYLTGLFSLDGCRPHELGRQTAVHTMCAEALADCPSCPLALSMLTEFYMSVAALAVDAAAARAETATAWAAVRDAATAAQHTLTQLAAADPIRNMLYVWKGQEIAQLMAAAESALSAAPQAQ
eukprot:gene21427-28392_t